MSIVERFPLEFDEILESFESIRDTAERMMMLIEFASCYVEPPASVAARPYPLLHKLKDCACDVYFWAIPQPDNTLEFHFGIEKGEGVSAKAFAVILARTLSGLPLEKVASVSSRVIETIFGPDLPPERRRTLNAMLAAVRHAARERLSHLPRKEN